MKLQQAALRILFFGSAKKCRYPDDLLATKPGYGQQSAGRLQPRVLTTARQPVSPEAARARAAQALMRLPSRPWSASPLKSPTQNSACRGASRVSFRLLLHQPSLSDCSPEEPLVYLGQVYLFRHAGTTILLNGELIRASSCSVSSHRNMAVNAMGRDMWHDRHRAMATPPVPFS